MIAEAIAFRDEQNFIDLVIHTGPDPEAQREVSQEFMTCIESSMYSHSGISKETFNTCGLPAVQSAVWKFQANDP